MSATRVYKLTTTRVTKILTDAGFEKSHAYGSRIKQMSAGFVVRPGIDVFTIEVMYLTHSARMLESERERVTTMLANYAEALEAVGYATVVRGSAELRLVVSRPPVN